MFEFFILINAVRLLRISRLGNLQLEIRTEAKFNGRIKCTEGAGCAKPLTVGNTLKAISANQSQLGEANSRGQSDRRMHSPDVE